MSIFIYKNNNQQGPQQGNVLFLILVAVVLFAGLSFALTGSGGGQQANSAVAERIVAAMRGQIDVIRSGFQECALASPTPATAGNYALGLPRAYNQGTGAYSTGTALPLTDVRCDFGGGLGTLGVDNDNGSTIFKGTRMLGQMPNSFPAWTYTNDGTNDVYFETALTPAQSADVGIRSALTRLRNIYSTSEAEIINNGTAAIIRICLRNGGNATCGS